jgi:hypothetical protein
MWVDLGLRFLLGGVIVSTFALLGDLVKPKSFAGLFSAAPTEWFGSQPHEAGRLIANREKWCS